MTDNMSMIATKGADMNEPAKQAQVVEHAATGLLATDRCDRCAAPAWVRVEMTEKRELLFCARHGTEFWPSLVASAVLIDDHRPFLHAQERHSRAHTVKPA